MNSQEKLLSWFHLNSRDLPFRKNKSPYTVWVSEVMLQQTRVAAMIPLYTAFLEKFPSVESLAKASEEEVLGQWKGLGYYSRAKNLRKGAIYLVHNFQGSFPRNLNEALQIPGIGPYTARAVLSIALGLPQAVLDGNVKRVLARFFLFQNNIASPKSEIELQTLADKFLNKQYPGPHNEALMELGATLCLPKDPKCLLCPLSQECEAKKQNLQNVLPIREKAKVGLVTNLTFLFLQSEDGTVFLYKTSQRTFFKNMFALPSVVSFPESQKTQKPNTLESMLLERFPFSEAKGPVRHSITHHKIQAFVRKFQLDSAQKKLWEHTVSKTVAPNEDWTWVSTADLPTKFPSSLVAKLSGFFL